MHVDGNRVFMRPSSEVKWVALNKPKGVICTVSDELGRPTAVSAIPRGQEMRLVPVGRLDRDSCGLLLLTNENSWVSFRLLYSRLDQMDQFFFFGCNVLCGTILVSCVSGTVHFYVLF